MLNLPDHLAEMVWSSLPIQLYTKYFRFQLMFALQILCIDAPNLKDTM